MMKKNIVATGVFAVALLAFSSCGGGKKTEAADSDTVVVEEAVEAVTSAGGQAGTYGAAFFNDAAKESAKASDSTYAVTASGLKYAVVEEGYGMAPGATDNVTVHYTGRLTDGTVFDSSVSRGEPATFPLNRVIPGWTEGLQLMKEGGVTVFYIPAALAYGEQGVPGAIPPSSDLIFEVELIKVN